MGARPLADRLRARFARDVSGEGRWIVVDTETSGLDPARDTVLAIGAVAVDSGGIRVGDSFEVVLRNEAAGDAANVAIHGIGFAAQRAGVPAREALLAFSAFVAGAPCVGYHTDFDRAVLSRAFAAADAGTAPARWLDIARLAATLVPDQNRRGGRSLDDWLVRFDIDAAARHTAAGVALASAELLLRLRCLAALQGTTGHAALARLSRQGRWLGGG